MDGVFGTDTHRVQQFKLSNDPNFIDKLRDVVGLYVDPPAHAIVLSIDEKSQIQALDRTLSIPETSFGWRTAANRAMLFPDDLFSQVAGIRADQAVPVESTARGGNRGSSTPTQCAAAPSAEASGLQ